jgi:hypothetical protein
MINHPSPDLVYAGLCDTDKIIAFPEEMQRTFCPKQIECSIEPSSEIQCRSLASLFAERNVKWIDFVSLDIEEATPSTAWHSIDHAHTNIRVASVEH